LHNPEHNCFLLSLLSCHCNNINGKIHVCIIVNICVCCCCFFDRRKLETGANANLLWIAPPPVSQYGQAGLPVVRRSWSGGIIANMIEKRTRGGGSLSDLCHPCKVVLCRWLVEVHGDEDHSLLSEL
jgi:hypothetical protein